MDNQTIATTPKTHRCGGYDGYHICQQFKYCHCRELQLYAESVIRNHFEHHAALESAKTRLKRNQMETLEGLPVLNKLFGAIEYWLAVKAADYDEPKIPWALYIDLVTEVEAEFSKRLLRDFLPGDLFYIEAQNWYDQDQLNQRAFIASR
jgi:hypothetical protein